MELELSSLYRVTIPGGGSDYWKVMEIKTSHIELRCLGVGRRQERINVDYSDTIVGSTRAEFVGAHVAYELFN